MSHLGAGLLTVAAGWRPLLDPLPIEPAWLPMLMVVAVAIAVVYKAIKLGDLRQLPRQAAVLGAQIVVFMILAALAIWVVVELV